MNTILAKDLFKSDQLTNNSFIINFGEDFSDSIIKSKHYKNITCYKWLNCSNKLLI